MEDDEDCEECGPEVVELHVRQRRPRAHAVGTVYRRTGMCAAIK